MRIQATVLALGIGSLALGIYSTAMSQPLPCAGRRVALTFDDGPRAESSQMILETLKKNNVPATFFALADSIKRAKDSPEMLSFLREIDSNALFDLGNHTATHPNLPTLGEDALSKEVMANKNNPLYADIVKKQKNEFFRAPYGATNAKVRKVLWNKGYKGHVLWQVDTLDWDKEIRKSPEAMIKNSLSELRKACQEFSNKDEVLVMLMHDIHLNTAKALPELLVKLQAEGVQFAHLDEIRTQKNSAWKPTGEPQDEPQRGRTHDR